MTGVEAFVWLVVAVALTLLVAGLLYRGSVRADDTKSDGHYFCGAEGPICVGSDDVQPAVKNRGNPKLFGKKNGDFVGRFVVEDEWRRGPWCCDEEIGYLSPGPIYGVCRKCGKTPVVVRLRTVVIGEYNALVLDEPPCDRMHYAIRSVNHCCVEVYEDRDPPHGVPISAYGWSEPY